MKNQVRTLFVYGFTIASLLFIPYPAVAGAPPAAQAVLAQESRWLTAIVAGDKKTIDSILSKDPEFTHITAEGRLIYRPEELVSTKKELFTMNPSEQTVDFVSNVAVVHGINTIRQAGKTLARERFTDIFFNRNGTWLAISAQETAITSK